MAKVRVPQHGKPNGFVAVETDATIGATVGSNLYWPDGTVVTQADFSPAPADSGSVGSISQTMWSLVLQIPANVTAVENATGTTGLFAVTGTGTGALRTLTDSARIVWTNGDGIAGNPTADLATLADTGTGALLAITRDAYGRVEGSKAATITGTATRITVTNGDAVAGLPTIDLATVADAGGGTLQKTAFDTYGRKTGTSAATTDDLAEGATNLYFTAARVLATVLAGLSTATNAVITATDSVLGALGKLQAQISGIVANYVTTARTISTTAPLTGGGDLSADRTLAITAATTVADGSMSAADKSKLDGIEAGATAVIDSIADADTTHAPSRNAVFDALALKTTTADIFADFVVSGLLSPTSASLASTLAAGTAYVIGTRVVVPATAYTYAASSDTYDDLSSAGVLTHVAVANAAAAPAVTANSLRLQKVVTSATAVTAVTRLAYLAPFTVSDGAIRGSHGKGGITSNTAFGTYALYSNTVGDLNNAIGFATLYNNTTGTNNNAVGTNALQANTTGHNNNAVGTNTLYNNTTGSNNNAIGYSALQANTTGNQNSAIGAYALANTTGSNNNAIGYSALRNTTTGTGNMAIGTSALQVNTTGSYNTAIGFVALVNNTASASCAIGAFTLYSNTSGTQNNAVGYNALYDLTTGSNNNAVGFDTGRGITTGSGNTIIGGQVSGLAANLTNNIILADGVGTQRINIDSTGYATMTSAAGGTQAIAAVPAQTDATASRALNTTYTNTGNRSIMVMATVRCAITVAAGNAYVQAKSDTATPPTTAASGLVGIQAGLLGEDNTFQLSFVVAAGKTYNIVSSATNGTTTLGGWYEAAF